jgi:2,4-dienoyl-CoA reductase-like NADH-dependent reductase (Old Yellow Enzyme family)
MVMPIETGHLFDPLTLPNGAVLPNRIAKAAMEEEMADPGQLPGQALRALYECWSDGGAGLIISGNVMVDPTALTGPGGVVLDRAQPLAPFAAWATSARKAGNHAWLQINHPGRQVYAAMGQRAVAPSAVAMDLGGFSNFFKVPHALDDAEIAAIIGRFADTAALTEQAGFTGVQIHAAHGYLLSQFLSPLTNRRADRWGGPLENRARLLLDIADAVRARVAPGFCVGVKLNSADFQKGGFEPADAARVVGWLNERAIDLVELSGGSYESPAMQGLARSGSTARREAYFIDFAREITEHARMPVMVTGGIHDRDVAERALAPDGNRPGVAMVGLATALAYQPDLPARWRRGEALETTLPRVEWRRKPLASLANLAMTESQLHRIGSGRAPDPSPSPILTLLKSQIATRVRTARYRKWVGGRN